LSDNINDTKKKVAGGIFWSFGERITAQLITTLVTIILARILDPSRYGIISILTVLISLCNVFVTSGFGSALVQKKEADDTDFNTAFLLSFLFSWVLYGVLFLLAPSFAEFYGMDELNPVLRVMALRLPIASVNTIQQANISRRMEFKRFFFATLFGTIISGIVGIFMALNGFGVWALVCQYLTNVSVDTIILWFIGGWMPKLEFSLARAKKIYSFGWKVLVSELTYNLDAEIRSLVVGKKFGASDLAFYDQGRKYPSLLVTNINSSISKVMLPAYSKYQDDLPQLKKMLRKSIHISVYVLSPILLGFASISREFVAILLGDKWLPAVPYLQLFCILYLTRPLQTACHQTLLAIGRSDLVLYIMIILQTISISSLLAAAFLFSNMFLTAVGLLLAELVGLFCFAVVARREIDYRISEQIIDIGSSLGIACIMVMVIFLVDLLPLPLWPLLALKIIAGCLVYFLLSVFTKNASFCYIKKIIYDLKLKKGK